jgi:hypothetical protein
MIVTLTACTCGEWENSNIHVSKRENVAENRRVEGEDVIQSW